MMSPRILSEIDSLFVMNKMRVAGPWSMNNACFLLNSSLCCNCKLPLDRPHSGERLGLALCKSIPDRLAGPLEDESELGKGSRFIFSVDVCEEEA
ncbi:Unannotated [Lentimonas sp. CC4]|nr:Unannotated [Lentimonas sp. CC4]CAA6686413.1 Unannotated [Lentimonas sp. CC6]CAA7074689.1 Unannotated [Lentimonas sp. CC4]CAA7169312.1 Unannotated [Lentimonas sp. CC21]CAA7180294.1 Unannotated [Lentimonas sp. CC8]